MIPSSCEHCSEREHSIFCDLAPEHCQTIDRGKTSNTYKAHQTLFYEGNQAYGLYCVKSGKVKVFKTDLEGNQRIVRLSGAGDILGYRCLLASEPYTATAETLEDSTICFIDKSTFLNLIEASPKTASRLLNLLAKDLGYAENQMLHTAHKTIRERLAELLLILKAKYGKAHAEGTVLEIQLNRQELADLIGTTQESLIRLISSFREEGLILTPGKQIVLKDTKGLVEIANLSDLSFSGGED